MKARIEADALASALKVVEPVAYGKGLPVLSGVLIEARGKAGLALTCTDLESTVTVEVAADCGKGAAVAPAKLLGKLASTLTGVVELVADDGTLTVDAPGSTTSLACMSVEDWPKVAHTEGDSVVLAPGDLDLIARILPFATNDPKTGARQCLHLSGNQATTVDGFRLGRAQLATECPELVIPVASIAHLFSRLDTDAGVTLTVEPNQATFGSDRVAWTARLFTAEDFPKVDPLIPSDQPMHATFSTEELTDALKRLAAVSTERTRLAKFGFDGACTITSRDERADQAAVVTVDGELPESLCVNVDYMLTVLAGVRSERVTIGATDLHKPLRIDDGDLLMLVMPVRAS